MSKSTPITRDDNLQVRITLLVSRRQSNDPADVLVRCGAGYIVERAGRHYLVDSDLANPVPVKWLCLGNNL